MLFDACQNSLQLIGKTSGASIKKIPDSQIIFKIT